MKTSTVTAGMAAKASSCCTAAQVRLSSARFVCPKCAKSRGGNGPKPVTHPIEKDWLRREQRMVYNRPVTDNVPCGTLYPRSPRSFMAHGRRGGLNTNGQRLYWVVQPKFVLGHSGWRDSKSKEDGNNCYHTRVRNHLYFVREGTAPAPAVHPPRLFLA